MIGNLLSFIASDLNGYICRHQGISPDIQKVILSPILNPDGSMAPRDQNVILLTLMDVRQDPASTNAQTIQYKSSTGVAYETNTYAMQVNLFLLFTMYFEGDKTKEALNTLTYVMRFFQVKSLLTPQNSPGLPVGIHRIEFGLETMDFQQKGFMWGLLGVKYMPCLLYKARLLTIIDDEPTEFVPPIISTESNVR